jgi:hypothetical protein
MDQQQIQSIQNYKKHGINILQVDNDTVIIKQEKLINGYILNQKQLVGISKDFFPDLKVKPVVFSLDVNAIDILWIENKMSEFGIKRNDLVKQLAIDKSSLSLVLSGKRELSKPMRPTFFYYFLTYELNKDFRSDENFKIEENI